MAVVKLEQQFLRAIGGRAMFGDAGGPDLEVLGELFSEGCRQVGHGVERDGPFLKEPFAHLARSIGWHAVLGKPFAKLILRLFEKRDHGKATM
jgi:hypothetical protein